MRARLSAGAVLLASLALLPGSAGGLAFAQAPPAEGAPAPSAAPSVAPSAAPSATPSVAPSPSSTPLTPPAVTSGKGAIVVALGDDAGDAARALAHDVYREAGLRPTIDEFTAKLLSGDAATEARATGKHKELVEIRAAAGKAGSEAASRHLLASIGAELGATIVVAVQLDGGRPLARALRTASAAYEGASFNGTAETLAYGSVVYKWPGATTTLLALFPASVVPLKPSVEPAGSGPLAPGKKPLKDSKTETPFWASPWFWGTVGGVAAVGVTVFVLSRTTSNSGTVRIDGTVGP
ncbi:MAG: hypothetical protein ABI193_00820 [Minicystis sp.]